MPGREGGSGESRVTDLDVTLCRFDGEPVKTARLKAGIWVGRNGVVTSEVVELGIPIEEGLGGCYVTTGRSI